MVLETMRASSDKGVSRVGEVPAVFEGCGPGCVLLVRCRFWTLDQKSADNG